MTGGWLLGVAAAFALAAGVAIAAAIDELRWRRRTRRRAYDIDLVGQAPRGS